MKRALLVLFTIFLLQSTFAQDAVELENNDENTENTENTQQESAGNAAESGGNAAESGGNAAESGGNAAEETSPTTTTTTTTPAPAAVGSSREFTFATAVPGLSVSMTFTQQENDQLQMRCLITTALTAIQTLERFCTAAEKPEIYLVEGHTDCSDLSGLSEVKAQKVATIQKPSEFFKEITV